MAKYVKPLKSISVYGEGLTDASVADEPRDKKATRALDDFLARQTMALPSENETLYVPFHTVTVVESTVSQTEIETSDPYGCKGGDDSSKTCEGTVCSMKVDC